MRGILARNADKRKVRSVVKDPTEDLSTVRCFYECVNQGMTSQECVDYIKDTIGANLEGHEIPNLQIKVSPPRSPKAISETYWMIGIPVNLYGEVHCNINSGTIIYPWDWEVNDGVSVGIPDVNCLGLDANTCCDKVLKDVGAVVPLVDKNGNCLSCWVHQEPLEPIISSATGKLAYLEYSALTGNDCAAFEVDPPAVRSVDDGVEAQVSEVRNAIDDIVSQSFVDCGDFIQLHRNLLLYGRAFPSAMSKISGLLCGICGDSNDTYIPTSNMIWKLLWIKRKLTQEINSDENCIIIYTDHQDKVLEPPKIGGSRHELDWDRDDPDCDDHEPPTKPDTPAISPVTTPTSRECRAPKIRDPTTGLCICPSPYTDDGSGGCNACEDSSLYDPVDGCIATVCEAPKVENPPGSGICKCESPYTEDGSGGCNACEDSSLYDPVDGCGPIGSTCLQPKTESPPGSGICICPLPYVQDSTGGCRSCKDPNYIFDSTTLKCVCRTGFESVNGVCQPDVSTDCTPPKVSDGAGNCVCPPGSQEVSGVCVVGCTVEDILEQFGTNGPCGNPYGDCLEKECGPYWSPDCMKLLKGTSMFQNSVSAWAKCMQIDQIPDPISPSTGAGKSKSGSSSKYKSIGSGKGKRRTVRYLKKGSKGGKSKYKTNAELPMSNTQAMWWWGSSGTSKPPASSPEIPSYCAVNCNNVGRKPLEGNVVPDPYFPDNKYIYNSAKTGSSKSGGGKSNTKYKSSGSSGSQGSTAAWNGWRARF